MEPWKCIRKFSTSTMQLPITLQNSNLQFVPMEWWTLKKETNYKGLGILPIQHHLQNLHQVFFSQLQLCFTHTFKIKRFGTPNPWIVKPIFVDNNQLVKVVNLQLTPMKCNGGFQQLIRSSSFQFGLLKSKKFVMLIKTWLAKNLCSFACHRNNVHLQLSTSIWYHGSIYILGHKLGHNFYIGFCGVE